MPLLIVPIGRTGAPLITIEIELDKTRANFARAPAGPPLSVRRRSDKQRRDHSWAHIKQVAHQGALRLDNCRAATELCTTKNDAGPPFLSWFSGLVISHRETKLFFASGEMIQLQLPNEFILLSGTAPSRARETRCVENRQLLSPTIPPPAPTPRCAGPCGDRPDLPADDWTAPSIAEPVAAAAIGSAVGSFFAAAAAMRRDCIARQQEQKN
jgi:hypothetical protein